MCPESELCKVYNAVFSGVRSALAIDPTLAEEAAGIKRLRAQRGAQICRRKIAIHLHRD
jgi:hypothetical protein